MAHSVTISGVEGTVQWGYHSAATLGAWTVAREGSAVVLTATIVQKNDFRISQRPVSFQAKHANGVWKWPITSLQITGGSLTAVLGPKE